MRVLWLLLVLVVPAWGGGCAFKSAGVPGVLLPGSMQLEALKRADYDVIGYAKGSACATYVGLWPLPIFWLDTENRKGELFGLGASGAAMKAAVYNAIHSVPEADALIAPRFHEEGSSAGLWYHSSCVTVVGKAISIKVDRAPRARSAR